MESFIASNWIRPALYQQPLENGMVKCLLCPHQCVLHEGKTGLCHTRQNINGVLYTLAYGNPCSANLDPIEKKPLFHFLPGSKIFSVATAGCNFKCLNCQNWEISQNSPQELSHYDFLPEAVVELASNRHIASIAFTYTEPTVFYEYVYDTAKLAHQKNMKTVIVSNGYINEKPLLDLCPFLDAANIDLKCFDDRLYRKLTGGSLEPILKTLKTLKAQGVWLEITNLIVPTYSDSLEMIETMCKWLVDNGFEDTPLHFSRFFPANQLPDLSPTPIKTLLTAREIAQTAGIKYVYVGNVPTLGYENTFCPSCKKLLIERTGFTVNKNFINEGKCMFCRTDIPGVWK